jgi:hypothetical protein
MSTPPVAPPPQKSNVLWWVLGLFGAGVVILGLGGLLVATYVMKEVVQVRETAGQVEVAGPGLARLPGRQHGGNGRHRRNHRAD